MFLVDYTDRIRASLQSEKLRFVNNPSFIQGLK